MLLSPANATGPRREFIRQLADFLMAAQISGPTGEVHFGPSVHMECSRHPLLKEFMMNQRNSFHRMEVCPPWSVGKQAVVRHRRKRDPKIAQMANDVSAFFFAELPPCLQRAVPIGT